jgi:hypothetical protein
MGAVAKSYRKGSLIYEKMRKYLVIFEEAVVIFDFATAPVGISSYTRKIYLCTLGWNLPDQPQAKTGMLPMLSLFVCNRNRIHVHAF